MNFTALVLGFFISSAISLGLPSEESLKKIWTGKWTQSATLGNANFLEIKSVEKNGFQFFLEGTEGMNLAEMNGAAIFEDSGRIAHATLPSSMEKSKPCKITFTIPLEEGFESKLPVSHLSITTEGNCDGSYNGISFDGDYLPEGVKETFKPSFNCREADTKVEQAICFDSLLADADRELSQLYFPLQSDDPFSKKDLSLEKAQRKWMKQRNTECTPKKEIEECLVKFYAKRIGELRDIKKGRKNKSETLQFKDYLKSNLDDSRAALRDDIFVRLIIRQHLNKEKFESLYRHNIYFSEEISKPMSSLKEIAVLAKIKGGTDTSGIVLTKNNQLWVLLSTVEKNNKWHPLVFGPKDPLAPQPEAVRNWLSEYKGEKNLPPTFTHIFP